MSNPVLANSNRRLKRIPVTVSVSCTRKKGLPHFHDYTHIWYVLAGQMNHTVNNTNYIQTPGSFVIVPPFTTHEIDLSASEETPVVVDISFLDNFLTSRGLRFFSIQHRFEEHIIPQFTTLHGERKEAADDIMRKMISEFDKKHKMSFDCIASFVADFLRIVSVEYAIDKNFNIIQERVNLIMDSIQYISENLNKKITIDNLCSVSTMSRRMFTDNFKVVTGMTVSNFILSLRLNSAHILLLLTDKTLNEISTECGFYDKSHLIHAFKESYGISPSKYREESRLLAIAGEKEFDERWGWLFEEEIKHPIS